MRKTLKIVTLILCLASVLALCAFSVCAENEYDDLIAGRTVTKFLLVNKTLCKTQYIEGEYFDPTGLYGLAYFAEGGSTLIPAEKLSYLETGALTPDISSITFICEGLTESLSITVTEDPFASQIAFIELIATKTDFLALDTLSSTAFEVKAVYTDGTSEIIDSSLCTFTPALGSSLSSNVSSVKVSYNENGIEYTAEVAINVQPIVAYEFIGADTAYLYEGLSPEAPRGLSVKVYYDEAHAVSKTFSTFEVSYSAEKIQANTEGKTTIGIVIDSQIVELEIAVLPISGYQITGLNEVYYYGDEISLDNFRVYAIFSDGGTVNVTHEVLINAPKTAVFGSKITASHNGYDLKDFLGERIPEGTLTVINQPYKVHYEVGELFDSTGLSLAIEYSNGYRSLLFPGQYNLTYSIPLTSDDRSVTAEYFGTAVNIPISVGNEAYIVKLELIGSPSVFDYFEGSLINTSGLTIQAYMSDGSTVIVSHSTLNFTPALNTPLTTDVTEIIISSGDGTDNYCYCSYPITVIKKVPTLLAATALPHKLVYAEGEIFDPDGLALNLIFNDMSSIVPASFSFSPELGSAIVLHSNATEKYIVYAVYSYEGQEFTYPIEITVTPAETEKLLVSRDPIKTVYNIGDIVELDGLEMILIYKDRTITSPVVPNGYYTYSPAIIDKDTKEISISFRGLTVEVPITVIGAETQPPVTTEPEPPVTTDPIETTSPEESSTDETTLEPDVTTEPETSGPEVTTTPEESTSPEDITTEDPETTTDPNTGDKKDPPSLLVLWIIVIVIIVVALIALIIYYKKNFT
jgi:hypothetical protein